MDAAQIGTLQKGQPPKHARVTVRLTVASHTVPPEALAFAQAMYQKEHPSGKEGVAFYYAGYSGGNVWSFFGW